MLDFSNYTSYIIKASLYGDYKLIFYKDNETPDVKHTNFNRDYDDEASKRAKRIILDIALNNDFEWFMTFTFDVKKIDRYNYQLCLDQLNNAIKNYNAKYNIKLKYIMVPELHELKEGETSPAIHFHMLASGFVDEQFIEKDKKTRQNVYRSLYFFEKFGRNQLLKIYDYNKFVAYYISKYVTKDEDRVLKKRYYQSQGLKRSSVLFRGDTQSIVDMPEWFNDLVSNYENGLVAIYDLPKDDGESLGQMLEYIREELENRPLHMNKYTKKEIKIRKKALNNETLPF